MRMMALVLSAGLAFACGKVEKQEITTTPIPGSAQANPSTSTSMLVATQAEIPACGASNLGSLVFVQSDSVFYACTSQGWGQVNVGSAAGADSGIACSMTIPQADLAAAGLNNVPASGLNFYYSAMTFKNNTMFVQARISTGEASYASSMFWTAGQAGYSKLESDVIALDVHGAADFGNWYAVSDKEISGDDKNTLSFVYSDPTLTGAKVITYNTAEDCEALGSK